MPLLLMIVVACDFDVGEPRLTPAGRPGEAIVLDAVTATVAADGASTLGIVAFMDSIVPNGVPVQFQTERGRWIGADSKTPTTISVVANGRIAAATLVTDQMPGDVAVTAAVGPYAATTIVTFTMALPETVLLGSDRSAAPANGETAVTVTVELLREVGKPSTGIEVNFGVRDAVTGSALSALGGRGFFDGAKPVTHRMTATTARTVIVWAVSGGVASDSVTVEFQ